MLDAHERVRLAPKPALEEDLRPRVRERPIGRAPLLDDEVGDDSAREISRSTIAVDDEEIVEDDDGDVDEGGHASR